MTRDSEALCEVLRGEESTPSLAQAGFRHLWLSQQVLLCAWPWARQYWDTAVTVMGLVQPSWGSHLRQILNSNSKCQEDKRESVEDAEGTCHGGQSQT